MQAVHKRSIVLSFFVGSPLSSAAPSSRAIPFFRGLYTGLPGCPDTFRIHDSRVHPRKNLVVRPCPVQASLIGFSCIALSGKAGGNYTQLFFVLPHTACSVVLYAMTARRGVTKSTPCMYCLSYLANFAVSFGPYPHPPPQSPPPPQ